VNQGTVEERCWDRARWPVSADPNFTASNAITPDNVNKLLNKDSHKAPDFSLFKRAAAKIP
jgi:hypothetical protein